MFKQKTSVLFVNTDGKDNTVLQVPTKVLLNWKKYFIILNSVIVLLIAILGIFVYQKTSDHYQEKLVRANKIRSMIDIKKVKSSFQSIDESMKRINIYLNQRGLNEMNLKNIGGAEEDFEVTDINEITEYYEHNLKQLESKVKVIPMGLPHNGNITSTFGYRHNPFTGYSTEKHSGIDFKGEIGESIYSTGEGEVEFAGVRGGYGNCVIVKHNDRLKTLYAHMNSISVVQGQKIKVRQQVGTLGNTGRSTGPHLHYEVILDEVKVNPQQFLNF